MDSCNFFTSVFQRLHVLLLYVINMTYSKLSWCGKTCSEQGSILSCVKQMGLQLDLLLHLDFSELKRTTTERR